MKQLSSVMLLPIDGGMRVSYMYNTVDSRTGDLLSANERGGFVAVDPDLLAHIEAVRAYIRENRLGEGA